MKEQPVANRPVDGEGFWNQVRAAYPKQQPLLNLNNAAVSPRPLQIDKLDHWNLGTYNSAIQAGIAPAIRFHKEIGTQATHARHQELICYWIDLTSDIPGSRMHTPLATDEPGPVSLFSIDGLDARKIERELRQNHEVHVKYHQSQQIGGLRVWPHI
ncbi:hypothetical protein LJY18_13990 [Pseudomonas sp. MMS21-TM103]|uniref:hypothetical protein n=1 Tax=Pseudomonas sp. MMS21 TM103 TaxID=2886506 RepID=UPI001EDF113A|nr:hypothetical protein [Pseudomonas sp. MMS21 TM103]MCG4454403.1 hypothetical protein [Pseudomonas sp. MMS21 TM103]